MTIIKLVRNSADNLNIIVVVGVLLSNALTLRYVAG